MKKFRRSLEIIPVIALLSVGFTPTVSAGTWKGGKEDRSWSHHANWDTDSSPFGTTVIFDSSGLTTRDVVNNIVTTSGTINSLQYTNYDTSGWHVTEIQSGVTLHINGSGTNNLLSVGRSAHDEPPKVTRVAIQGEGSLTVRRSTGTGTIYISNSGVVGEIGYGELDLSGLASFSTESSEFVVGGEGASQGVLRLAVSNHIVADTLRIGRSRNRINIPVENASRIHLGASNTFHVGSFQVAAEDVGSAFPMKGAGSIEFTARDGSSTMTLRGKAGGSSRANMAVGYSAEGSASLGGSSGVADFRGGTIDFMLDTLRIGFGNNSSTNQGMLGEFSMDAGTVDALDVFVGRSGNGGKKVAAAAKGVINIEGGDFLARTLHLAHNDGGTVAADGQDVEGRVSLSGGSLSVEDGIVMGSINRTEGVDATAQNILAVIDITGGTLSVNGDIAQGSDAPEIESQVNLSGGKLDLNGHEVTVSQLNLRSGVLSNLGEYNDGATLIKSGAGQLVLDGLHTYTGETRIEEGEVFVTGTLANTSGVRIANGGVLTGDGVIGSGVVVEDGGRIAVAGEALQIDGLSMEADSTFAFGLGTEGLLVSTAAVSLDGDLLLTLEGAIIDGEVITLLKNESGVALAGGFASVNGTSFQADQPFTLVLDSMTYLLELSYHGSDASLTGGDDLVLRVQVVPEPGGIALLLVAGGAVVLAHRRRRGRAQTRL